MTPGDLVQRYLELRAYVEARTKAFEDELAPYKQGMETIEGAVHKYLDDNNLDNIKCETGTAFKKSGTRVRVVDRNAFNEFVGQQPDFSGLAYFTNAVSKEMIVEYVKQHETPPPGVDYTRYIEVQFRKGS